MTAGTVEILIAATHVNERLLDCLAECRATIVRSFEEARRALHERLFSMIVIDMDFDGVRTCDLLQHVRSLAHFDRVPVVCVRGADTAAGINAALERLVAMLGGQAFIDLQADGQAWGGAFQRLCRVSPRPLCILVIDPDVDAAHQMGELLEQLGHEVDFAYDGQAGLDAARRLRPDAAFVSVAPAAWDACRLAGLLRREPDLCNAFLVALAGPSNPAQAARLRQAGFDQHLTAPAGREPILKVLQACRARAAR